MSNELEQPRTRAPADGRRKEQLDVVIVEDVRGSFYQLPVERADEFRMGTSPCEGAEEVGGRHHVWTGPMTRYWYHSNWAYGPYVWWRDMKSYRGWHWHPNPTDYRAYDVDD